MKWFKSPLFRSVAWAIVVIVVSAVISVAFWEQLNDGESLSSTIRNIGLTSAAAIALPLAIWRAIVAGHQANTAQLGLLNERYQKGAEMLGSSVLPVRLGGIYALQRLAEECPEQYQIPVMRLFCAFVRLPTKDQSLESGQMEIEPGTLLGIRQDIEAVMEAIGSRAKSRIALERKTGFKLDLRGANLPNAQFLNADLSNAFFHHSKLSGAYFANADLSDAFFTSADLSRAEFRKVNFTRTRLWSANLSCAMLQDTDLSGMDFHDANLSGANLLRANLSGATFGNAIVTSALLESANLSRAGFLTTRLCGARLMKADLSGAHFLDANLNKANLSDANLSGVEFSNSGRQPTNGLTQAQLDEARADPNHPPKLTGVLDAESGEPLVWHGKLLNEEA